MRRRVLAISSLIALASACGIAHAPADASSSDDVALFDAPAEHRDTALPDAPICNDADGDGWTEARCGGEDCDDTDPLITPDATRCTSPTSTEGCVGGSLVVTDCDAATPYCDARSGACVVASAACGDGVVHPGEACDETTGACDERCRLRCNLSSECPEGEMCVEPEPDFGHCAPARPDGAALGERCATSDECASSWCDPEQGRCSAGCSGTSSPRCATGEGVCETLESHSYAWTPGAEPPADSFYECEYPCARDAECPLVSSCTLHAVYPEHAPVLRGTCLSRRGTGTTGSAPIGSACDPVIGCDSNTCVDGLCTRMCVDDTDCAAPLSHCTDHDFSADFGLPPGMQIARVCS